MPDDAEPVRWEPTFPGGLTEAEAEREIARQREGTGLPREAFRLATCEGGTYAVLLRTKPYPPTPADPDDGDDEDRLPPTTPARYLPSPGGR